MSWNSWPFGHTQIRGLRTQSTLCLQRPFGQTLIVAFIILLLLAGGVESIARSGPFQALLTAPAMDSRHYQLGRKLFRLDALIKNEGPIDCLAIGSSMVDNGFDPLSFQSSYKQANGQEIRCFNFGIDASTAVSAAALAQMLVEDYQPRLLIYGTSVRDYAVPAEDKDPIAILESDWIQYRLGHFSLNGWLIEHSYFYRYRYQLFRLSRYQFEVLHTQATIDFGIMPNGFTPLAGVSTYINEPPDPNDDSFEVTYNDSIFSSYNILTENLSGLEKIMSYSEKGTQVIITEMPVADGLFYFFGNGKEDYDYFLAQVDELAKAHQVPFWQTDALDLIPDNGWADYSHLNTTGATIFSNWLGQQVGETNN